VDAPIGHQDVTTIMRLLGDIQRDVELIREVVVGDGEEEAPEDHG
jgi:hypothetical protein